MSKLNKLNRWLTLLANLGVVAGLVFVAVEVRTNTEANQIAIDQAVAQNWMALNGQVAQDGQLATILERAASGVDLDAVEARRFEAWVRQHLTHASQMLRLYDAGLLDPAQLSGNLRDIRELAQQERFRGVVEAIVPDDRFRRAILDEDGLRSIIAP